MTLKVDKFLTEFLIICGGKFKSDQIFTGGGEAGPQNGNQYLQQPQQSQFQQQQFYGGQQQQGFPYQQQNQFYQQQQVSFEKRL